MDTYYTYDSLNDGDPLVQGVHHTLVTGTPPVIREDGGYKYVEFNATDLASWFDQAFSAANAVTMAFEVDFIGAPEGFMELMTLRSAGKQGNLLTGTTRAITLRNAADGNVSASPALATGKYVIRVGAKVGTTTSDGHYLYQITRSSDGTEIHAFSSTEQNTGTTDFTSVRFGDFATTTDFHWRIGRLHLATGPDALNGDGTLKVIDPYTAATAPQGWFYNDGTALQQLHMFHSPDGSTLVSMDPSP